MSGRGVKCVFFHAELKDGAGTLALVEYTDGTLAVLHNDQPVGELQWPAAALEQGVTAFTEFQRKLEAGATSEASKA